MCVCCSGQLEDSLKAALQRLSTQRRYEFWSQYVRELVCVACENEEGGVRSLPEIQMLISAWRTLLILSTNHVGALHSGIHYIQIHENAVYLHCSQDQSSEWVHYTCRCLTKYICTHARSAHNLLSQISVKQKGFNNSTVMYTNTTLYWSLCVTQAIFLYSVYMALFVFTVWCNAP